MYTECVIFDDIPFLSRDADSVSVELEHVPRMEFLLQIALVRGMSHVEISRGSTLIHWHCTNERQHE